MGLSPDRFYELQAWIDQQNVEIERYKTALKEIGDMGPHTAAWSAATVAKAALRASC